MKTKLAAAILIAVLALAAVVPPAEAGKWGKHHHHPYPQHHRRHGYHHSHGNDWAFFACGMAALVGLAVLDSALEQPAAPVYTYRTVTRQEWIPAREEPYTERRWVTTYGGRGHYEEYTTTRWVPGHYETVTVREPVCGR